MTAGVLEAEREAGRTRGDRRPVPHLCGAHPDLLAVDIRRCRQLQAERARTILFDESRRVAEEARVERQRAGLVEDVVRGGEAARDGVRLAERVGRDRVLEVVDGELS